MGLPPLISLLTTKLLPSRTGEDGGKGRDKGRGVEKGGIMISMYSAWGAWGGLCNTEKKSNEFTASYYADGQ